MMVALLARFVEPTVTRPFLRLLQSLLRASALGKDVSRATLANPALPATSTPRTEDLETRYRDLLTTHGKGLRRVAASYSRSAAEREDLAQDIALAIWRALPNFRGDASLRTFAYRIAHNRAISHLRKRRPDGVEAELVDEAQSPELCVDRQRSHDRLVAAVQSLPVPLRQIVALRLEDLSYAEIAEIAGISQKNVSVRLTRARKLLRQYLGGQG